MNSIFFLQDLWEEAERYPLFGHLRDKSKPNISTYI